MLFKDQFILIFNISKPNVKIMLCFRLKLYLEQFAIPVCVLNSELPANIRCHSVSQFNRGIYDIIVASDEKSLDQPGDMKKYNSELKKTKRRKDKESGVSRGIDFQFVANVINFDFPLDIQSYIHRAGRTARGTNQVIFSSVSVYIVDVSIMAVQWELLGLIQLL